MEYRVGDVVSFSLETGIDEGCIIGFWREAPDICVVADARAVGMPMNICHIVKRVGANILQAQQWRQRYVDLFPTSKPFLPCEELQVLG